MTVVGFMIYDLHGRVLQFMVIRLTTALYIPFFQSAMNG